MQHLRKRLICRNRGTCEGNRKAIKAVADRYIKKMALKGWCYSNTAARETGGNCFFYYEMYITLYKPNLNNKKDLDMLAKWDHEDVLDLVERKGNVTENGVFVMNELKDRGWESLSYVSKDMITSDMFVCCGYSGAYNQSKLVKVFKQKV